MKKLALPLLASLFVFGTAQAADYKLDPTHTKAVFYIDHFNTSTNSGGFHNITGDMTYSLEKQTGSVNVIIPAETLNTGLPAFDNHIKSADMLDVAKYPTIEFKSSKWNFVDNKPVSIDGVLTMKGESHPIQLKTTKFGCYFSPIFKADVCGGDFEATIDRTQWGIDFLVKDGMTQNVTIKIQAEAIKQ
ncbi:YceI family protein [Providencia huaxiensis]|uniref:Polyisoprenoid-binding protein n=1 Tax=Providencia huaxiensis TaxID=2027290 RepID=A0A345LZ16_9GAMM|nr:MULTISPECIES: YceI family protein [Providencia]AXH63356.1 polyisoprenoid-binding protein [Providencia huaxiensis]MBQ0269184.1 polyisoprenoid-binding protein [Providencia huaxiensis]MBQ0535190.1 polyisoprenoid-binding protein [Providencia huaxiensis]MBQ0589989.1 polyisoprenoid-binding protein [Providencia huaxiensis]MBZ3680795.1 polyisoprenoid-binding protein [Providencia rettgeri]